MIWRGATCTVGRGRTDGHPRSGGRALLKAGSFRSQADAVAEALRVRLATRPQLRIEAAIRRCKDAEVTAVIDLIQQGRIALVVSR